ncbi:hypothetical protein APHDU1_0621 [Anaplasma phagocytophilum]|uniref:Uncharacterized protein n=1 Tax=Anaplasma phagocytophilum str. NCH-1 TaxID=1359161 RepID=A0A0F3NNB9_ANAPH|nr:hypothetical protein APHWEB_0655 [Anaplasma phagocytophilum str. Webster]KJV68414.1 hypothetical protein EPHNCH_0059 [Anaplasma phagocytophilum str. NCH-1]KJV99607.1 hypothetical protein OTSANNIE_0028 [Anaplasma phagocytophilum str. Annie]KJZ99661.1 hypothetical protein APHDU1_0621 [Anaplasma phagocytophilum]
MIFRINKETAYRNTSLNNQFASSTNTANSYVNVVLSHHSIKDA